MAGIRKADSDDGDDDDDDEEDGIYYDEVVEEEEDGFDDELRDNEEDVEAAGVVDLVTSEGKSEKNRERLQELCARVLATGERTVTASDIAGLFDFPFDKFQETEPEDD